MISSILLITIGTATFASKALANGLESCAAGIAAIESTIPPGDTRPVISGSLFDVSTLATLDGRPLVPNTRNIVPAGVDLLWNITAVQVVFTGLLVRVEKASADFTNVGADSTLKDSEFCGNFVGVIGVTHATDDPKVTSLGTITFPSGGIATLDITVIYDEVFSLTYAFDTYELEIHDRTIPTSAPVEDIPTAVPTTANPALVPLPVSSVESTFPSPILPTAAPLLDPTLTPEPTKEKGMMKGGMDKDGKKKGGMDKDGKKKGGMDKDGKKKGGMDKGGKKKGGMDKDGKKKGGMDKDGKKKGGMDKDGKKKDGMKMKKGSYDDDYDYEYDDDYEHEYDDEYEYEEEGYSENEAPATIETSGVPMKPSKRK
jgi:hypothetical protein